MRGRQDPVDKGKKLWRGRIRDERFFWILGVEIPGEIDRWNSGNPWFYIGGPTSLILKKNGLKLDTR